MASKRYVCPKNGTEIMCKTCGDMGPHVKEELVAEGAAIPMCTLHDEKLVLAE